jgi:hypothetical protein
MTLIILPDRTNLNRRRRFLQPIIDLLSELLSNELSEGEDTFIIDLMPLPICRFVRCGKLKIMKDDIDFLTAIGYSAIDKTHYFGYKLTLVMEQISNIDQAVNALGQILSSTKPQDTLAS